MLKAVIFDMDGVIVDSEPIHFAVDKMVLNKCGVVAGDNILNPYVGVSNPEMWKDLKEKYNLIPSVEELLKLQSELKIEVLSKTKIEAIDGINELLNELKQNNIVLAVASSSPRFFIEAVLETLKINEYFKVVLSGEEVQRGKPCPDIFLKAAEMLKVDPQECIVIEDSANGVKAAVSAGMKCIGYANLNSGSQDLSSASIIVDSICRINYDFMKNIKQLSQMSNEELWKLFPIIISEYNPKWPEFYLNEKCIIENALGLQNIVRMSHYGSTSIPGICAKPTIDILLEVVDSIDTEDLINKMCHIGYIFTPQKDNPPPHMMFLKGYTPEGFIGQAYHLHVRYKGDWDELYFRDYLILNPHLAKEYEKLKLELKAKFEYNRDAYTQAKTEFVRKVTEQAKRNVSAADKYVDY